VTAPKVVLFVCVGNSGRSLMAESVFNANPPPGWLAVSAGTKPAAAANPRTAMMLAEIGLALPAHPPQLLGPEMMDAARVRITMGCLDDASCPARLKTLELRDWALPDPASLDDEGFRRVRDQIVARVRGLRTELLLEDRRRGAVHEPAPETSS
jgi:arsenate reductase (thioredoxin)